MKILLAADGSACAQRAATWLVEHVDAFRDRPEIHLVNVQVALPPRAVAAVDRSVLEGYYREECGDAVAEARRALERGRIPHEQVCVVGDPGHTLAEHARNGGFSLVIMGSRGHGALSSFLLGSVARNVMASCDVPVLVIR